MKSSLTSTWAPSAEPTSSRSTSCVHPEWGLCGVRRGVRRRRPAPRQRRSGGQLHLDLRCGRHGSGVYPLALEIRDVQGHTVLYEHGGIEFVEHGINLGVPSNQPTTVLIAPGQTSTVEFLVTHIGASASAMEVRLDWRDRFLVVVRPGVGPACRLHPDRRRRRGPPHPFHRSGRGPDQRTVSPRSRGPRVRRERNGSSWRSPSSI